MDKTKILIVDDDITIRKLLVKMMALNEYEAVTAESGEAALKLLKENSFDLVLLDIMLDQMDGFQVIQHIRGEGHDTPIIVISGRTEDCDALYALSIGADDYITKPFNPVILGAKVKALIRRQMASGKPSKKSVLKITPFELDYSSMRFFKNGDEIILSSKEFLLMKLFMENPEIVFNKDQLYDQVWGESIVDENAIMVYISKLRSKIEEDPKNAEYIKTIRGLGYKFSKPDASDI